jgi:phosphoenolpyruvate phosphomutase
MNAASLRDLMDQPGKLVKLVGAHDAIGARLAEAAGFDGVWASSFELATSQGLPDCGLLPAKCRLAIAAVMARAATIPVVVDCETGGGDPDELAELIQEYETVGVQGICIEDAGCARCSLFPGEHTLAPVKEFAAKIEASCRARTGKDFLVLARVQALVAGKGQAEAMCRARAYAACGADAVVIHSRSARPDEVLAFAAAWELDIPLVIIPTTYHTITADEIGGPGTIKAVIYANYGLRASIEAVRRVFRQILADGSAHRAEECVASLDEVFALQRALQCAGRQEEMA